MSPRTPEGPVERWRDAPDAEASQAKAAALVGQVPAPAELSDEQLDRIGERLAARARRGRAPMPSWLKWAIGAGAFGGAPLAFAAVLRLVFAPAAQDEQPRPAGAGPLPAATSPAAPMPMEIDLTAPGGAALVRPEGAPAQAEGPGEAELAPGPQERAGPGEPGASAQELAGHGGPGADSLASARPGAPGASSRKLAGPGGSGAARSAPGAAAAWVAHRERGVAPARAPGPAAPAPLASPAAPSSAAGGASNLEAESALLSTALARLRRDKDPAGALEALDEHRRRFPGGVLRDEERLGRVDALLALGRRPEALVELEALGAGKLEQLPRGTDLRVLEAELLFEAKRCDRAVPLFDALLARSLPAAADERALFGRASCRVELGEPDGAADDLRRCLARHPSGRFAAAARRLLESVADE